MISDRLNVLVVSSFDGTDASAIGDFLFALNRHSAHRIYYLFDPRRLGGDLDLAPFDAVVVFWSVSLTGSWLGARARERIRESRALKVVFAQDEYADVQERVVALAELGAHVLFTCVDPADHETFYPRASIPTLRAVHTVLPGYVPDALGGVPSWRGRRPLDVGYRSRVSAPYLGKLARHKQTLPDRFGPACAARGLKADLSVRELDRLYGRSWTRFLASCRCVLGSPSGASVVDFTGRIRRDSERLLAECPSTPPGELGRRFFDAADGKVVIDTVSARVFEAAALGCTLVHVEGRYAGILEADRHYIKVAPDYSNLPEVLDAVADEAHCREVARRAHADLVASGRYSFGAFVRRLDGVLAEHARPTRSRSISRPLFYVGRILRHDPAIVPRGGHAVFLPLGSSFAAFLLRRVAVGRFRSGPLLGRFLRNPGAFAQKLSDLFALWRREPAVRVLLAAYARSAAARSRVRPWQLAEDLLKLSAARLGRTGGLASPKPFTVFLSLEAGSGILRLVSREAQAGAESAGLGLPELPPEARIRAVVWDHSEVGREVAVAPRPGKVRVLSLGMGGIYRFEALGEVLAVLPEVAGATVAELVRCGPVPLTSRAAALSASPAPGR